MVRKIEEIGIVSTSSEPALLNEAQFNQLRIFLWQNDGTAELYPYHAIPVDQPPALVPGMLQVASRK